jgi:hypothetical protein
VLSSTDPTGGSAAWHVRRVDTTKSPFDATTGSAFIGVSCPSAKLCVAVDDGGNVFSTTNPAGSKSAWHSFNIPGSAGDAAVSCLSAAFCVVVADGDLLTSSNPTGGRSAWRRLGTNAAFSVFGEFSGPVGSCVMAPLCVFGEIDGGLAISENPTASDQVWRSVRVDATNMVNAVSCSGPTLCVAVDSAGNVIVGNQAPVTVRVPRVVVTRDLDGGSTRAHRFKDTLGVDSGLVVECPPGGPPCSVTGAASEDLGSRTIAHLRLTVQPGRRRKVAFNLTAVAARRLIKTGSINAELDIVAHAIGSASVADGLVVELDRPGPSRART